MSITTREPTPTMSPATDPEDRSAIVVSAEDLLPSFHAALRAEPEWGLGVEYERLPVDGESGAARAYHGPGGVAGALESLQKVGWRKETIGGGDPLLVHRDGLGTLTCEPGGQLELSGAIVADVHQACAQMERERALLVDATRASGIAWIGVGFHPFSPLDEVPWAMKPRYGVMKPYLAGRGRLAHAMMKQTATVQTNLDFDSEEDMAEKFRVASWATPLLVALFANSPLVKGRPSGALSTRSLAWRETDADRCGFVRRGFEPDFCFRDYLEYLLDVPMFFVVRQGRYLPMTEYTFRRFMTEGRDGDRPTLADWDLHKSTVFPEVRLRGPLEVRAADAQSPELAPSVVALTCGLLYDAPSRAALLDLVADIRVRDIDRLLVDAARFGPEARAGRDRLGDLFPDLIAIARRGLQARSRLDERGADEGIYLEPLEELVCERGLVPATELLRRWEGEWRRNPRALVNAYRF